MTKNSTIEWTDHTFNPWWGCVKVSQGCKHCYAETLSGRFGQDIWGPGKKRRTFGPKHWNEPLRWNTQAEREGRRFRVFCASMADVFEDNEHLLKERDELWQLIETTPHLDWLLLTKRPENCKWMLPVRWLLHPMPNVWLGTSVEDQQRADERIPHLLDVPAAVHFLSCEPLLGPVDLHQCGAPAHCKAGGRCHFPDGIHWVIAGGESGPGARPMHPNWARSLRDQCQESGVPFFFKQWGEWAAVTHPGLFGDRWQHTQIDDQAFVRLGKKHTGRELDFKVWNDFPQTVEQTAKGAGQ